MRPKKVLFYRGIVYRGGIKRQREVILLLIKAISILYAYIAALYRIFLALYRFPLVFSYTIC